MHVLVMLLFVFAHAMQTLPLTPCAALLEARPIVRTPRKTYPNEIPSAGTFTRHDEMLPKLETGFYLYLITANGDILTVPKFHPERLPPGLATHKTLLHLYMERIHRVEVPDVIVAAGEFQIAFDEVVTIRNRSGNFRGGLETLGLAVEVLSLHGLPITARSGVIPVVPGRREDMGHTPQDRDQDRFRLQVLSEVYQSARGRILRDIYLRMFALLKQSFPQTHGSDLIKKLVEAQTVGARLSREYDGYHTFSYPLQSAFSPDGLEYGIWATERLPDHGGADGFSAGPVKQIENFLLGAQEGLDAGLREKWRELAREFAQIDDL